MKNPRILKILNNKACGNVTKDILGKVQFQADLIQKLIVLFCSGKFASLENNLKTNFPNLIKEWDF